jgi:hypothetical protein
MQKFNSVTHFVRDISFIIDYLWQMPLVSSYHSKVSGETNYHNHSDCEEGNKIKSENRLHGTGKLLWCKHCSELLNSKKLQVKRKVHPSWKKSS